MKLIFFSSTKSAIVGMMEGLNRELRWEGVSGVKTTIANPSWINTGFAKNPRSGSEIVCPIHTPEQVADNIIKGLLANDLRVEHPSPAGLFCLR